MPAPRNTTKLTADQVGLNRALATLVDGTNIVAIMDAREQNYPVHYDPTGDPDHFTSLRDTALN